MGKVIEINERLWRGLSAAARRAKRTPEGVLRGLIRDFLETQTDRDLDQAIAGEARLSHYLEADAVRLVREYRKEVQNRPAGKVGEAAARYRKVRGS